MIETVVVPGLPPSDNHAYAQRRYGKGRAKTSVATSWAGLVNGAYKAQIEPRKRSRLRKAETLEIQLRFYFELRTKIGDMRRWDTSSHQKLTIDAITEAIGLDDRLVVRQEISKHQRCVGSAPQTQIEVRVLTFGQ